MAIPPLPNNQQELQRKRKEAMLWLMAKIAALKAEGNMPGILSNAPMQGRVQQSFIGSMFVYVYDPKWKNELPYYDKFPLCLPYFVDGDRFQGLNLHYLPPAWRIQFLNKLMSVVTDKTLSDQAKFQISYGMLVSTQRYREFVPCVHTYLDTHIRTRLLKILPHEWEMICLLPYEAFEKADKNTVWKDSKAKVYAFKTKNYNRATKIKKFR